MASAKVARAEQKRAAKIERRAYQTAREDGRRGGAAAAALRVVVGKAATEEKLQAAKARKAALAQDASAAE